MLSFKHSSFTQVILMKDHLCKLHSLIVALFLVFCGLFCFVFITNSAKAQNADNSLFDKINIEHALQADTTQGNVTEDEHGLGLNQNGMLEVKPSNKESNFKLRQNSNNIPAFYDLRNVNNVDYITDIKDQGNYSTCWAFSSLSSAESNLIKNYGINAKKIFSPYHLAYFNYYYNKSLLDPLGNRKDKFGNLFRGISSAGNEITNKNYNYLNIGGNEQMATFTLANGKGFVSEEDYKYEDAKPNAKLDNDKAFENCGYNLENSIWVAPSESATIKENIIKYGAASTGVYYSNNNLSGNYAYYYNGDSTPNHSVDIIGWDDNYSKDNFNNDNKPNKNGAWLVKNSWGTNWGNQGYFWVSYQDASFLNKFNAVYFFDIKQNTDSGKIYQYDGCSGIANLVSDENIEAANVFYSDSSMQKLDSVSFAVFKPNTSVEINIYTNLADKTFPESGTLANEEPIKAQYNNEGYYTLNLKNSISIDKNSWFAITIKQSFENNNSTKYSIPIVSDSNEESMIHYITNSNEGESYLKEDNNWVDFAKNANLKKSNAILKAHTVDVDVYLITIKSNGPGAAVPGNAVYVKKGESTTLSFTPETDCYIDKIFIDNNQLQEENNNFTFENIDASHDVKVEFKHIPCTINANAGEGGSITPSGEVKVDYNQSQSFNITADANYNISDVIIDGIPQGPMTSYTFNEVTTNHTISVVFAKVKYTIKATAKKGGTIDPLSLAAESGSDVDFNITPDNIHKIKKLTLDNNEDVTQEIINNKYTLKNVQKSHTLKAEFELKESADLTQGIYKINSAIDSKFSLDANDDLLQDHTNIKLYENNDSLAQRYYISKVGNFYKIKAMCSDQILSACNDSKANCVNLELNSNDNIDTQLWNIIYQGEGTYTFVSKCNDKCINVTAGKAENENNLDLCQSNGTNAQKFYMQLDEDPIGFNSSAYMLESKLDENKVLDISAGSCNDYANLQIYSKNYTLAQRFYISYMGAGVYKIKSVCFKNYLNKFLEVAGAGSENETNVWQNEFNYTNAQLWKIKKYDDGTLGFSPLCAPGKCLDVKNSCTSNGTNIQIYEDNSTNAQKFIAIELEN